MTDHRLRPKTYSRYVSARLSVKKMVIYILKPPYGDHKFRFQKPKKGSKIDPPKNPENALIGRIVGVESLGPKNSPDFVPAFGISGFRGSKKPIFGGFRMKKVRDEGTPKTHILSKFIVILKVLIERMVPSKILYVE